LFAIVGLIAAQEVPASLLKQAQDDLLAGHYPAVVTKGTAAAAQFQKTGDRAAEARARTTVGLAHLYSGDYNAALQAFTEAVNISRQIHDVEGEITRLSNIGTVFYFQGRYGDAMDRYQQALRRVEAFPNEKWTASRRQFAIANIAILYQTLGQFERALELYSELLRSDVPLPPREQAQLLSNVGALRRRLGDPRKALDTYRAAQALYKKAAHRDGEIAVLNNIGIVEAMDLGDFNAAAATFTDALRLAQASGDRPLAIQARLDRGEALYRAESNDQSAADFKLASDEATALGELEESWKALYGLARIAASRGDAARAHELLVSAVSVIESLRAGLGGSSLRSEFLADKRDVYDLLIEQTADAAGVFRLMEQSRARTLQDRLGARPQLDTFARSLAPGTAVLEYWLGSSSAAVLWISSTGTGIKRWPLSNADREAIAALPSALADPQNKDWREAAAAVSKQLLSNIPLLQNTAIHNLVIIPDGALGRLPFEALPFGGSSLLIERFTVSYSPSASLLATAANARGIRWPWQRSVEAFADPAPGAGISGVELTSPRAWPRLPEAAREANGIAHILGGSAALHIGPDARKEFFDRLSGAPVLHFATHAFADPQDSNRSYILLAPASRSERFDYLFLKEVYGARLSGVELATVSACQTDVGKLVRGEGVESFSRAFLAAGARSVVTSLWNVGDRSTAEMMLRFYSQLASGASEGRGLA
jgi:CHAT domain-containing protein